MRSDARKRGEEPTSLSEMLARALNVPTSFPEQEITRLHGACEARYNMLLGDVERWLDDPHSARSELRAILRGRS